MGDRKVAVSSAISELCGLEGLVTYKGAKRLVVGWCISDVRDLMNTAKVRAITCRKDPPVALKTPVSMRLIVASALVVVFAILTAGSTAALAAKAPAKTRTVTSTTT